MELYKRLLDRGHDVVPISTNSETLPGYAIYNLLQLPFLIPKDCDVYHALTPLEGFWIPRNKAVVTFHDLILLTDPDRAGAIRNSNRLKLWLARRYFAMACHTAKSAARLVCDSEMTRDNVIKHITGKTDKLSVIKLGIRDDLEPKPKPDNILRFGYLGQLDRRKRVDIIIRAFKLCRSYARTKMELVIAGIGVEEQNLKALAADDKRIKFLGLVPDDKLVDFYNSLDVFYFPSAIEGYGLPIIEAMACKKPVLVLEDAILPPEIKARCLKSFFRKQGQRGYALSGDPEWLQSNYQFAKQHSWDKCVDEYEEIYQELVKK
jgi:glycosyltransferase involved in cell wall biosynthesis